MKLDFFKQKKTVLAICLAGAAVAAAVGGTLAIYTSQVFQRGVVRNRDSDIVRFSSDVLTRVSAGTNAQESYYPVDSQQDNPSIRFSIYNYDQTKSTLYNEQDLEYTITFRLENTTSSGCFIESKSNKIPLTPGGSHDLTGTLAGGVRSSDTFTFYFPKDALNTEASQNPKLTVTVIPTQHNLTQRMILTGTLIPIPYGATQGFQARLDFPDSTRDGTTPADFAAYNVLVSVSGGKGSVEILWDSNILDIDPFFLPDVSRVNGSIVIPMDAADETASYLIPFYKKTSEPLTWDGWLKLQGKSEDIIRKGAVTPNQTHAKE